MHTVWHQQVECRHTFCSSSTRSAHPSTGAMLVILCMPAGCLVYFGENINSVAGQHWQLFATQDYFDEHGVFYNAIVSGPALITLLTVLVSKEILKHRGRGVLAVLLCHAESLGCLHEQLTSVLQGLELKLLTISMC